MESKDIKQLVADAYPNKMEQLGRSDEYCLALDEENTFYIKFTTIFVQSANTANTNKHPINQARFTKIDDFDLNCKYFILAGDSDSFHFKKLLQDAGITDDYIIAIEPKNGFNPAQPALKKPTYTLPTASINAVIQKIKAEKDIGIYRKMFNALRADKGPSEKDYNSCFGVFIKVTENGVPTDLYLKRYFEAADQRVYRNIKYKKSAAQAVNTVSIAKEPTTDWPKNLLVFGAPGTGKSFAIDKKLRNLDWQRHTQRVTFYEDYSYEKFVGAYVPKKEDKQSETRGSIDTHQLKLTTSGSGITYEFVPGPFLKMMADAYANKKTPYVLVIEEINRANAASVFGDMFQLLDRGKDGESEYGITLAPEMENWLIDYMTQAETADADEWLETYNGSFKMPHNIYLWATMNSADQGVFPLDSAFKRRWSFLYKSVTDNRTDNNQFLYTYVRDETPVFVSWDALRSVINDLLCSSENNVEEDRCIGAWYFKPAEMNQIFEYTKATPCNRLNLPNPLCDKLFHYLRQDVFRNNPGAIFKKDYLSMYKLREALAEGTPLLNVLNLPQDSLEEKYIIPANKMKFMVEEGKVDVSLDELAEMASKAGVSFNKNIVFNMNDTCNTTHTLNKEDQSRLIKETLDALQKGCTSPEAFETLRAQFKNLPYAPNANNENGETKEAGQSSNPADNTPPVDTVADQPATTGATQEINQ